MKPVRVATVIFNAPSGRAAENLARMETWVASAREEGAVIVCFPELNVTGYGTGLEVSDWAAEIRGGIAEPLTAMAARHEAVILAGLVERGASGRLHASHVVVSPAGPIGVYRKLHLAPPEKKIFTPGDRIPLFEAAGVRFGIQLCYDAHFPELSTRMALDGAEVIFFPHASPRGTPEEKLSSWMRHLPARAFDNGLFVVACNQAGENGTGLTFPGVAMAIGPDGRILAEHRSGEEGLLVVDLRDEDLAAVRSHPMRYFLPNRRPEIFRRP
jgi:N-carbamoylputrescine amidase